MINTIYSAVPVRPEELPAIQPENMEGAIVIREEPRMVVTGYQDQSDLWGNSRVKKALCLFPIVGFMSTAALTCSYTFAYLAYCYRQDDALDTALTTAKLSQICLLGNLGAAIGTRLVSKISGKYTLETRRIVLHTLAASFPCFFARAVCCEVEPDTRTIAVLREEQPN